MAAVPGHRGWSASSPSLPPPSQATHPPPPRGAHARLISRHRGLLRPTAVCQRRHATMHPGDLNVELVRPRVTHHWLRLVAGSRVVVTPSPGSSPPARTPLCPPYVCDRWARGPTVSHSGAELGESRGVHIAISDPDFLKGFFRK
jgi:hypothetical protein